MSIPRVSTDLQGPPTYPNRAPRVFVSLDQLRAAAPESHSFGHMLRTAWNTLVEWVLSWFTANHSEAYIQELGVRHRYVPALEDLALRGRQLYNTTVMTYLTAKECRYVWQGLFHNDIEPDHLLGMQECPSFSIPMLVDGVFGYHFVNLKCTRTDGLLDIEFFDSKGLALNHPNNARAFRVVEILQDQIHSISYYTTQPIQNDGHSCGVFTACHVVGDEIPDDINVYRRGMAEFLFQNART